MKKVIILIGNYGSGKTEIALNMAVRAAAKGKRTQVIDLDRINDYFRMSDFVKLLDEKQIHLVSPTFAGAGITQTNMPAAVGSAFARDWDLVLALGGGTVLKPEARALLDGHCFMIYLKAGPDTLAEHLAGESGGRPLLAGKDLRDSITRLLSKREET